MADVFISYKRGERDQVALIAAKLQELGLSVWFDARLETGGSFHGEINREVRAAKAVIACWTREACESPWVVGEAQIGFERGALAPVYLDRCDLPPPFNGVQTLDLLGWSGAHDAAGWLALLDRLGPLVGRSGLRHIALALAAGEPVRVMGANEAVTAERAPSTAPRPAAVDAQDWGEAAGRGVRTLAAATARRLDLRQKRQPASPPKGSPSLPRITAALTLLPMWLVTRLVGEPKEYGIGVRLFAFVSYLLFGAVFCYAMFVIVPVMFLINALSLFLLSKATTSVWARYLDGRALPGAARLSLCAYAQLGGGVRWVKTMTWLRTPFLLIGYVVMSLIGAVLTPIVLLFQILTLAFRARGTLTAWLQGFADPVDEDFPAGAASSNRP